MNCKQKVPVESVVLHHAIVNVMQELRKILSNEDRDQVLIIITGHID